MTRRIEDFIHDERGATAMEYGLIATLIALVIIAAVTKLGQILKGAFNNVAEIVK